MKYIVFTLCVSSLVLHASSYESTYTSIADKDCKVTEVYEHNMGVSLNCEGFEQLGLEVSDSDARMSITVTRGSIAYPQHYSSSVDSGFSSLGSKIEWRYTKGESFKPHAFIARVNVASWDEKEQDSTKNISYLAVSKIDKISICVIGKIPPQKNQNILARALADKAQTMPCLLKEQRNREKEIDQVVKNYKNLKESAKSEESFRYFQYMGPLELAFRTLKKPDFPTWRMRLRLYPIFSKKFPSKLGAYRVVIDQINLSYALFTIIKEHGSTNIDQILKNNAPSKTYSLKYIIMRTPASFMNEAIDLKYNAYLEEDSCGLQKSCTQLWEDVKGDWGTVKSISLIKSLGESMPNLLLSMLRTLSKEAGWILKNGSSIEEWNPPEIPEGLSEKNPWIEVIIENYAGTTGRYLMEWHNLITDDSITKTLYRIYYDEASQNNTALIQNSVLCVRGNNTANPAQMCP